jgi:hypothetical protein
MTERHVTIYRKPGVFAGWPANHGLWHVGDRIIVGFEVGAMDVNAGFHAIDRSSQPTPMMAESIDDGETWETWHPNGPLELKTHNGRLRSKDWETINTQLTAPKEPIDFHRQLVKFRMTGINIGPSYMCVSQNGDGQRTWAGPFALPMLHRDGMMARTSYLPDPTNHLRCTAFWTATKESDGKEGQPCCVVTEDGGLSWEFRGWIDEPPKHGFGIMPSAVRLENGDLFCAVRWRERGEYIQYGKYKEPFHSGIICYRSSDEGVNWELVAIPIRGLAKAGNPPDLLQLKNSTIVLVYGWRNPPFGVAYQVSSNNGITWSNPMLIRKGAGCHDLGYTRSAVRSDNEILTTYYWNDAPDGERYIACTIWEP